MKRITARFKLQRRLGVELPGLGKPGALARKPYPPGQHGNKRKKYSDYALRLEEKQKVRAHYVITEKQLQRFIGQAKMGQSSNWTAKLVGNLEKRLDNVVFRMGIAPSRRGARQLVSHRHITVNGEVVDIASYHLRPGDKVAVREKSKSLEAIERSLSNSSHVYEWITWNNDIKEGTFVSVPARLQIPENIKEQLIVELYNK